LTFFDCLELTVCDILLPLVCVLFLLVLCSCNSVQLSLKLIKGNLLTYLLTYLRSHSHGVQTLRTQDTSDRTQDTLDLPNFGPRTLWHVRSVPTFRHWCRSVFLDTSATVTFYYNSLYFHSFYRKFAKYATVSIYFIYFLKIGEPL